MYISAYSITRHYGGAAEGGWWFNWYEFEDSEELPAGLPEEEIEAAKNTMYLRHEHHEWGNIYSVNGGMKIWVGLEDQRGENATDNEPIYQ